MRTPNSPNTAFTLVEVLVAMFIILIIALVGGAYYSNARVAEITEWHEANALFLCEREVEAWNSAGYGGFTGFRLTDVGENSFLPWGYSFLNPDPEWDRTGRFKPLLLDGFSYRIRAQLLYTDFAGDPTPEDFFVEDSWFNGTGDITYRYRQLRVIVQWGAFSGTGSTWNMRQETRIAR
jgi:prepilin-type N-terminal cleavage/methylation domain-containing protein